MDTRSPEELDRLVERARETLLQYAGVISVGWGYKERGGSGTQQLSLVALVREKKPLASLHPSAVIPKELFGIPTDVIRAPRLRELSACEILDKFEILVGGLLISNLKTYLATNSLSGQGVGTLGFFATDNRVRGRDNVVLLTNHHVLTSGGGVVNDLIFQPKFTGGHGAYHLERADMHPIGEIRDTGLKGHHPYGYPEDNQPKKPHYVDCATAKVKTDFSSCCNSNKGIKFDNVIHNLKNAVGGTSNAVEGVARVRNSDLPSGGTYPVFKVGARTGWTKGKLKFATVNAVDPDNPAIHQDQVMIIEDLGPNCGGATQFSSEGDSGSVILNDQRKIIGLLFADGDTGVTAACHIHPVMDLLGITMVSTQHTAGASGGGTSLEASLALEAQDDDMARAMALRHEILSTARGRFYHELVQRHREEVMHLVNHVRPVTVAWHRLHGPDFLGHVVHASRHARHRVPRQLHGTPRDSALARILEILAQHGSSSLRFAAESHSAGIRELFARVDHIEQLAEELRDARTLEGVQ